jgi:tetratricopeptide (TPR) repeat protein
VTPELWQKVRQTLDALLALEAGPRERQLAQLRRDDPTLAAEVDSFLSRHDTPRSLDVDGTGEQGTPTLQGRDQVPPTPLPVTEPLTQIGPYTLQGQVGQGGMGVVWRARDRLFRRSLAVKVLAEHHNHSGDLRRRFVEEAQLMGQLQHPGIPPVHDLGELPDGRPYFAMKLIKGKTLAALLKERTGPDQEQPRLLAIFEQVCQTLAYAHAQRILHRDLKPSNIMVGAFGEVQVMDWGLAKLLGSAAERTEQAEVPASTICTVRTDEPDTATQTGQALGTPAYMAPEQARGETGLLDERCDVFGLGAILCEILTGQPAFVGRNTKEVLHSAQKGDTAVALARLEQSGADRELVKLARHCLAADRQDRPAHAGAVAQALTDHLAQVQERLRHAELERKAAEVRAAEQRKRRRVALRLGSIIALLVVVLGVAGWWMDRSEAQARRKEEERQVRGLQAAESLCEQVELALAAGKADRAEPALKLLRQRLADLNAGDLQQRLAQTEKDLAMLRELQRLFFQRWQVAQQVVLELLYSDKRGEVWTKSPTGTGQAGYAPVVNRAALRQDYAAAFAAYGLAQAPAPTAAWVEQVRQSHIKTALLDALDQWFLIEPESAALLAVLNALDAPRAPARQLLADRAANQRSRIELTTVEDDQHEPATALYLSELLPDDRAVALLKKAVARNPDDHRLLTVLVYRLLVSHPMRATEAVSYARAAHALQPRNACACLLVAVALNEERQWDESLSYAHQALTLDPNSSAAHNHLGSTYNHRGEYDHAIPHLNKAIALDPKNAVAHNNLGFAYMRKGDVAEGIRLLKKAIDLDPQCITAHTNLGSTFNDQGAYDAARAHLDKAIAIDPKNAMAHNNLGFTYLKTGDVEQGLRHLKTAIELDPKDVPALTNLGSVYNDQGEYDQAIVYLKRAIELDAKNAMANNNLGFAYLRKGDFEQGVQYFKTAIALDAKNTAAHTNLGSAYNDRGKYDEAIPYLKTAIELDAKNAMAHNNLGFAYLRKGDADLGFQHFKTAVELDAKNVSAQTNLGSAYNDRGQYDQAIPHLKTAILLDDKNSMAHNNLGFAFLKMGNYDLGIQHLKTAIELDPKNAAALSNLGSAYNDRGAYDQAIPPLNKAIALEPKNFAAHNNLGFAYAQKGDYDRASLCLKKSIEFGPSYLPAYYNLSFVYIRKGDWEQAIASTKKIIALDPKNADAHENLGVALLEAGRFAEARDVLKKLLDLTPTSSSQFPLRKKGFETAEAFLQLEARLDDIAHGTLKPKNFLEAMGYGRLCRLKQYYAASSELYDQALTLDPAAAKKLTPFDLLTLARVNLLAGGGQGHEPPAQADRPTHRARALPSLQQYLKIHQLALQKNPDTFRYIVQQNVRLLTQHADLASVRPPALDSLPEDERQQWRAFWQDVQTLLERADAPADPEKR